MYGHGYNWREEPRGIALSSVVLLGVFVLAAAFLFSMVMFRPWADGAAPAAAPEVEAQQPAPSSPEAAPPAAP